MIAGGASADASFREWMRNNLIHAADVLGLTIKGEPILGWRLRSISVAVERGEHALWLRVVSEKPQWLPDYFWTGNADANVIIDVIKPRVLDVIEWDDKVWLRRVRVEVMTRMSGDPCSPTDVLRDGRKLPRAWWAELRRTLGVIHSTPTARVSADQDKVSRRIHAAFGDTVDVHVREWVTVHGDLHWGNLLAPEFGLVDWELWGRGPAGTDEATLYCYSLLVPAVAQTVHEVFARVLNSDAGRVAQVHVAARLLTRVEDYPDIAGALRQHVTPLVDELRQRGDA